LTAGGMIGSPGNSQRLRVCLEVEDCKGVTTIFRLWRHFQGFFFFLLCFGNASSSLTLFNEARWRA
jgi:hypothetical protein